MTRIAGGFWSSDEGVIGFRFMWRDIELAVPTRPGRLLSLPDISQMAQDAVDFALECERRGHVALPDGSIITPRAEST